MAQNQTKIRGEVYDQNKEVLPFVTVVAREKGKKKMLKATVCDLRGNYTLSLLQKKQYELEYSFAGYKKKSYNLNCDTLAHIDIARIVLEKDTIQLQEVEVKPLVHVTAREIVYNIMVDPERKTSNMQQIIEKVPTIHFDGSGNIAADDGESIQVTLNGKDDALLKGVDLKTLLSRVPAMGMAQVRVIKDPPPKYGKVKYVVELSQDMSKKLIGVVVAPDLTYSLQNNAFSPSAGFAGSIHRLRYSGSSSIDFQNTPKSTYYRELENFEDKSLLVQEQKSNTYGESYKNRLAMSIDVSKKHYLGMNFSYNTRETNFKSTEESVRTGVDEVKKFSTAFRNSDRSMDQWKLGIDYQIDRDKEGSLFHISAFLSGSPEEEQIQLGNSTDDLNQKLTKQNNSIELNDRKIQLSYGSKIGKKLQLNNYLSYFERKNTDRWESYQKEAEIWQDRSAENSSLDNVTRNLDLMTFAHYPINRRMYFSLNSTLSYPLKDERIVSQGEEDIKQYGYEDLLVSARGGFSVNLKKRKLIDGFTFNYSVNQLRPDYAHLSINKDQQSEGYYQVGNPNLEPELMHTISFGISLKWFNPFFSYHFSNNRIGTILNPDSEGNMVKSYANNSRYRSYSMNLLKRFRVSKNPQDRLIFRLNPSYSEHYTQGEKTNGFHLSASCTWMQEITENLNVFANLNYWQNFNKGYQKSRTTRPVVGKLALGYGIKSNGMHIANISLSSNPFAWGSNSRKNTYTNDSFRQITRSTIKQMPLNLSVSFSFGKFKVEPVRGFDSAKTTGFAKE
jgi:hypothetical protein